MTDAFSDLQALVYGLKKFTLSTDDIQILQKILEGSPESVEAQDKDPIDAVKVLHD